MSHHSQFDNHLICDGWTIFIYHFNSDLNNKVIFFTWSSLFIYPAWNNVVKRTRRSVTQMETKQAETDTDTQRQEDW